MKLLPVKCNFCGKKFYRSIGRINESKKSGWKQFCSPRCLSRLRTTRQFLTCANPTCGQKFYREISQIKIVKRSFCSSSCTAVFNNRERYKNLPPNLCANPLCRKPIPRGRKYCSSAHRINPKKIPEDLHREQIINRIKDFYRKRKRIPVKREMYGIYKTARYLFGNWNNAVKASGFKPNPVMFSEKQIANDGHICDSVAEKIIDNWLSARKIIHQRNVAYPESPYTADFAINGKLIEFFGLAGEMKNYDNIILEKRKISTKSKIPLIEIYPRDLFPIKNLNRVLSKQLLA
ncbi:MAG: hypothetical protein Q8N16_01885 [bacterium]|nr:hypothetical protein [bacterium]